MRETLRRDPRREWIARNRLHPEHASVLADMAAAPSSVNGSGPAAWCVKTREPSALSAPMGSSESIEAVSSRASSLR